MATRSRNSAVLLLSSGLDSAANLALAPEVGFEPILALTIDYGQIGAARERSQAAKLCKHFKIEHVTLEIPSFSPLVSKGSALLDPKRELPSPKNLDRMPIIAETAKAVWVPNRNAVLISMAAALAESRGIQNVAVGFNAEEAVTFPDNTIDFMNKMTDAFVFSTANQVEVVSATASLTKKEIVARLGEKKFPFDLLWSCYRGGERHCGECESCKRLKRAVKQGLPKDRGVAVARKLFGIGVE